MSGPLAALAIAVMAQDINHCQADKSWTADQLYKYSYNKRFVHFFMYIYILYIYIYVHKMCICNVQTTLYTCKNTCSFLSVHLQSSKTVKPVWTGTNVERKQGLFERRKVKQNEKQGAGWVVSYQMLQQNVVWCYLEAFEYSEEKNTCVNFWFFISLKLLT